MSEHLNGVGGEGEMEVSENHPAEKSVQKEAEEGAREVLEAIVQAVIRGESILVPATPEKETGELDSSVEILGGDEKRRSGSVEFVKEVQKPIKESQEAKGGSLAEVRGACIMKAEDGSYLLWNRGDGQLYHVYSDGTWLVCG